MDRKGRNEKGKKGRGRVGGREREGAV